MPDQESWNWDEGKKKVLELAKLDEQYAAVHELVVSADGERIATVVQQEDDSFGVCVNGETWDADYEKAYGLV